MAASHELALREQARLAGKIAQIAQIANASGPQGSTASARFLERRRFVCGEFRVITPNPHLFPGIHIMSNSTLILVVQSEHSTVRFLCSQPLAAQLHSLSAANVEPVTSKVRQAGGNGSDESLSAGVHVLVGGPFLAIGCKVLSGEVVVIVPTGGEDPWPTPPPPMSAGQSRFPKPPPPLSRPQRNYVLQLMNTPR